MLNELRRELAAHQGYLRRSLLFLVLGLLAIGLGGWLGARLGLTLLLWHGALALTHPIVSLLPRERRDARDLADAAARGEPPPFDRALRAIARMVVLLAMTMPSAILLAIVFLSRIGRDAFDTPLAASVCLIVGGVLLLVVSLGAVAMVTRSLGLLLLAYAAATILVLLGMSSAGSALLPGIPLWIAIATGHRWGLVVTLLWQVSCAALLLAIVVETRLKRR